MPDFRFKLPVRTMLTIPQQIALEHSGGIMITGGPGSGKTVVTIRRFIKTMLEDRNAILFTFNRTLLSSIRGELRRHPHQAEESHFSGIPREQVQALVNGRTASIYEWFASECNGFLSDAPANVIGTKFDDFIRVKRGGRKFSQLFLDESQDLHPNVIQNLHRLADTIICGADRSQDLQGHYAPDPADDVIHRLLPSGTVRQTLTQNYRNSREIFEFARKFVPGDIPVQNIDIDDLPNGNDPDVRGGISTQEQNELMLDIIRDNATSNIGILVHFSWQVRNIKLLLETNGFSYSQTNNEGRSFSYYFNGMPRADRNIVESSLQTPFVLTFDSCKGLEFDIVIIPYFEKADWALTNQRTRTDSNGNEVRETNADGTPKMWATPNHYYVACTRARSQLYVLYNQKPRIMNFYNPNSILASADFSASSPADSATDDDFPF